MKKKKPSPKHPRLRRLFYILLILALVGLVVVGVMNIVMVASTASRILSPEEAGAIDADCILVLGAGVRDDGTPSHMLRDRIDTGIDLYRTTATPKLLMSGDHGRVEYDEVNVMRDRALAAGVPSVDIFMDHAGFSTYDSLYRARDVFAVRRLIIVTQEYHLPRALYIAEQLGLEAYGVPADLNSYFGQFTRNLREIAARAKDMLWCAIDPGPVVLGEVIPITGSGEATMDKVETTKASTATAAPVTDAPTEAAAATAASVTEPTVGGTITIGYWIYAVEEGFGIRLIDGQDSMYNDGLPKPGVMMQSVALSLVRAHARETEAEERFAVTVDLHSPYLDYTAQIESAEVEFRTELPARFADSRRYYIIATDDQLTALTTVNGAEAPYALRIAQRETNETDSPALTAELERRGWTLPGE